MCLCILTSCFGAGCSPKDKETSTETSIKDTSASATETTFESVPVPSEDVVISEEALPFGYEWQYDITFPDWQDRSSYAANNRLGFYTYSGQGEIYVTLDAGCGDFTLYINDRKIDTSKMKAGTSYKLDIAGISRNGTNSLQLSGLKEGSVSVRIPYPTLKTGSPEDVGLNPKAIELIDKIIASDVEHGFPSAQIVIARHGRVVYENCWGNVRTYDEKGNPVDSEPVTMDTLYDLASVTKMYSVNFAIQYLVSNGQLDIDTKIADILGNAFYEDTVNVDYGKGDRLPLGVNKQLKAELTIRDLMLHQGGFPEGPVYHSDYYDRATKTFDAGSRDKYYAGNSAGDELRELTLKNIFKTPLMFRPGTKTLYSDLDYMILCYVVEEVTGKRMDEFLEETFWKPLGLTHITYNPLINGFTKDSCAATELEGNTRDGRVDKSGARKGTVQGDVHDPVAYYCMGGISGHAGLFSNAEDLAVLASVMLTGGYGGHRFFSQDVIDMFTSLHDVDGPGYALGWWREGDHTRDYYFGSVTDSNVFGHQGFTGPVTMIDPENDLVVVILTNKIHSKVMKGDDAPSAYEGNVYTTPWMGFIAEILEIGRDGQEVDDSIWQSLVDDMAEDYMKTITEHNVTNHDDPRWKAYEALKAVDI